MTLPAPDRILPFQLESLAARGRFVRLGQTLQTILTQHAYPPAVCHLLAEACAMAAALGTTLKFDGIFTLQVRTDGPIGLLVADVTSAGGMRAYAQYDAERLQAGEAAVLGKGTVVMTVDHNLGQDRYQGVVALEDGDLGKAFQTYFRQSEQIPTGLMAAAQREASGLWSAACLLVQRMPSEGGSVATETQEEDWPRVMTLMQTCTAGELLDTSLSEEDLLYRLFHEEGVRVFDEQTLHHVCRCSRERIEALLSGLPEADIKDMIENGKIVVTCQFCGKSQSFTQEEAFALREAALNSDPA